MAKRIDPSEYVSVTTGAKLAGCTRAWMRRLVQRGLLAGLEIDGVWFVKREAAASLQIHPTKGRPQDQASHDPKCPTGYFLGEYAIR